MGIRKYARIKEKDNVAVVVHDTRAGDDLGDGLTAVSDIPQAHKIALEDIVEGGEVIRYGTVLGYACHPIQKGEWIHEELLTLPPPDVRHMAYGTNIVTDLPEMPVTTWEGYRNPAGGPAGTRNILGG